MCPPERYGPGYSPTIFPQNPRPVISFSYIFPIWLCLLVCSQQTTSLPLLPLSRQLNHLFLLVSISRRLCRLSLPTRSKRKCFPSVQLSMLMLFPFFILSVKFCMMGMLQPKHTPLFYHAKTYMARSFSYKPSLDKYYPNQFLLGTLILKRMFSFFHQDK